MANLTFTGDRLKTLSGLRLQAIGTKNEKIGVTISDEAIQDFGEMACMNKASEKYGAGKVEAGSITVKTADFRL